MSARVESNGSSPMRSVERAFDVLEVMRSNGRPLRLSDVARSAGLHPATTQRILGVLERRGYVARENSGYVVGVGSLLAANRFLVDNALIRAATPVLQQLAAGSGLTATLYVRMRLIRVLIARVEGKDPLRYEFPLGQDLPLHLGAGKVLACAMPQDELASLLETVSDLTWVSGKRVSEAEFRAELKRIREQGYYVSREELRLGRSSVTAPIHAPDGQVLAAVSISGQADEMPLEASAGSLIAEVRQAAAAISARYA
jgi:IclR family transcriptional regulator, acetate operon repressor